MQQVRAGTRHARERGERRLSRGGILGRGGEGQREEGRVVLRRAPALRDRDDPRDGARAIGRDAATHRSGPLGGQGALARVVAASLAPQDQEAIEVSPVVDRPGVAPGAVRHLCRARQGGALRRGAGEQPAQIGHDASSDRGRGPQQFAARGCHASAVSSYAGVEGKAIAREESKDRAARLSGRVVSGPPAWPVQGTGVDSPQSTTHTRQVVGRPCGGRRAGEGVPRAAGTGAGLSAAIRSRYTLGSQDSGGADGGTRTRDQPIRSR